MKIITLKMFEFFFNGFFFVSDITNKKAAEDIGRNIVLTHMTIINKKCVEKGKQFISEISRLY